MIKRTCVFLTLTLLFAQSGPLRAADAREATAVVDKAIKALGGEEKLGKVKVASSRSKGKITINGTDSDTTSLIVMQGLDHFRMEFEGEFGGNNIRFVTVLAGDKGSRKFGETAADLDKDALAEQKRTIYLAEIPVLVLPMKSKDFKLETIADEKVEGKAAAGIKVTAPDKKDFKIYFDKETGLPVRIVAKVLDLMGQERTQETTYSVYKELAGIKKATRIVSTRDGEKFMEQEITEFKVLDKVDPKSFTEP